MNMKPHIYIVAAALVLACVAVFVAPPQKVEPVAPAPVAAAPEAAPSPDVAVITPAALRDMIEQKAAFTLLDVRQPEEFAEGHIDGATLIPLADLPNRLAEVPQDKKVVVYCKSGARSAEAAKILKDKGYADVVSLDGGITAWLALAAAPAPTTEAQPAATPDAATPAAAPVEMTKEAVPVDPTKTAIPTAEVPPPAAPVAAPAPVPAPAPANEVKK
jgi:rhodanese-related sulfurtransferase